MAKLTINVDTEEQTVTGTIGGKDVGNIRDIFISAFHKTDASRADLHEEGFFQVSISLWPEDVGGLEKIMTLIAGLHGDGDDKKKKKPKNKKSDATYSNVGPSKFPGFFQAIEDNPLSEMPLDKLSHELSDELTNDLRQAVFPNYSN